MVKVCPDCGSFWFGGDFCHKCGVGHRLIDTASPEAEPWVHKARVNIRTFYWARSAMLLSAIAMMVGIVLGLLIWEKGLRDGGGWAYKIVAFAVIFVPPYVIHRGINWLFRRQVNKDLKASGKTTATAPDMVDEIEERGR